MATAIIFVAAFCFGAGYICGIVHQAFNMGLLEEEKE